MPTMRLGPVGTLFGVPAANDATGGRVAVLGVPFDMGFLPTRIGARGGPPTCERTRPSSLSSSTGSARMYVIDYEYAGNSDPMWDLGDLSVEGNFNDEQDTVLLQADFADEASAADVGTDGGLQGDV